MWKCKDSNKELRFSFTTYIYSLFIVVFIIMKNNAITANRLKMCCYGKTLHLICFHWDASQHSIIFGLYFSHLLICHWLLYVQIYYFSFLHSFVCVQQYPTVWITDISFANAIFFFFENRTQLLMGYELLGFWFFGWLF